MRSPAGKKSAKSYERPGLTEEEIEEIREAFNLFDTDGSGAYAVLCVDGGTPGLWRALAPGIGISALFDAAAGANGT
jgi:hypothetical protein